MNSRLKSLLTASAGAALALTASGVEEAGNGAEQLAKKLQNPVASLISVPFQSNFDWGGENDTFRYLLNFQPVVPVSISEDANVIIRTIVPFTSQSNVIPGTSQTGLGDITQSFFYSPKDPTSRGLIWGLGPVFLYPSATDHFLGSGKFGLGPTFVLLKQQQGWTYGLLFNHIWSVAGSGARDDVSSTFLQPFLSYTTKKATSFTLNTESSYDWEHDRWTTPINAMISQVFKAGKLPVSAQIGARYTPAAPAGIPDWGFRFNLTFLFPK